MTIHYEIGVIPAPSGFGEWQYGELSHWGWACEQDLLTEIFGKCHDNIFELGVDELPTGIENILGSIRPPTWRLNINRVFVRVSTRPEDPPHYFAIATKAEEE